MEQSEPGPTWDGLWYVVRIGLFVWAGVIGLGLLQICVDFSVLVQRVTHFERENRGQHASIHLAIAKSVKIYFSGKIASSASASRILRGRRATKTSRTKTAEDRANLGKHATLVRAQSQNTQWQELDWLYADFETRGPGRLGRIRRLAARRLMQRNVIFYDSAIMFTCGWVIAALYITGTYLVVMPNWLKSVLLALGVVLWTEFVLRLFVADSIIWFALSVRSFCEILAFTSAVFASKQQSQNFSYLASYSAYRQFCEIEKTLLGNVNPKPMLIARIGMHVLVAVMILASSIALIETLGPFSGREFENSQSVFYSLTGIPVRGDWNWFNSFYFMVVTLATVGYGDYYPVTMIGRAFTIIAIVLGIFILGSIVRELPVVLNSAIEGGTYRKTSHRDHIVIYGTCLDLTVVKEFVVEFYADRRNEYFDLVFMSDAPQWTLQEWSSFTALDQQYEQSTCFLKGSLANDKDFDRAYASLALACFVFSCSKRVSPVQSDAEAVLILSLIRARAPDTPLYSIMHCRESVRQARYVSSRRIGDIGALDNSKRLQRYFYAAPQTIEQLKRNPNNDTLELRRVGNDVLSLNQFQTTLMAESLRTNGVGALISDLLFYTDHTFKADLGYSPWAHEYSMGSSVYITSRRLPESWNDRELKHVLLWLYDAGIVPLGFRTDSLCDILPASPDFRLEPNQTCLLMTFLEDDILDKVLEGLDFVEIQTVRNENDEDDRGRKDSESSGGPVSFRALAGVITSKGEQRDDEKRDILLSANDLFRLKMETHEKEDESGRGGGHEEQRNGDGQENTIKEPASMVLPFAEKKLERHVIVCLSSEGQLSSLDEFLFECWKHSPVHERTPVMVLWTGARSPSLGFKYSSVSGLFWTSGHGHSKKSWREAGLRDAASVVVFSHCLDDGVSDSQTLITLLTLELFACGNPRVFFCVEIQEAKSLHLLNTPFRSRRKGIKLGVSFDPPNLESTCTTQRSVASRVAIRATRNSTDLGKKRTHRRSDSFVHSSLLVPFPAEEFKLWASGASPQINSAEASFASGELIVRWTPYILLLRAMHEPGLTDFVQRLLGIHGCDLRKFRGGEDHSPRTVDLDLSSRSMGSFSRPGKAEHCTIKLIPVPVDWIDKTLPKDRIYRNLYQHLISEQNWIPIGLYRSGQSSVRYPRYDRAQRNPFAGLRNACIPSKCGVPFNGYDTGADWKSTQVDSRAGVASSRDHYSIPSFDAEIDYTHLTGDSDAYAQDGQFSSFASSDALSPTNLSKVAFHLPARNELPFVYTLPEPYALVHENDGVFVLMS